MSWAILAHSQEGSEWKHHKYIKREGSKGNLENDGKYYYPDSYKGGRHLPKGNKSKVSDDYKKRSFGNGDREGMDDWEKKVHAHVDKIISEHPDMFKTGADVARGIMDDKNLGAVKNTLKAFGVNVDKMSDSEIRSLRSKISSYYDKETTEKAGKATKAKSSGKKISKSDKKSSNNKDNKKDDKEKKEFSQEAYRRKNKRLMSSSKKPSIIHHSADYLEHHGILGMRWGKKNGPPYPIGTSGHSASEKKAGWWKSILGGKKKAKGGASGGSEAQSQTKSVKDMSDDELNRALNRLRNEKAYKELTEGKSNNNNNNNNNNNHESRKNSNDMKWSKNLSDKEVQDYVKRLKNEKQYDDLTGRDIAQGHKFAKALLISAGTIIATTIVTDLATKAGKKATENIIKKFSKETLADMEKKAREEAVKEYLKKQAKDSVNDIFKNNRLLPMKR